ncbi:MAG: cache domain-containing protein [Candidatus Margulisiibacteriota bacterium]
MTFFKTISRISLLFLPGVVAALVMCAGLLFGAAGCSSSITSPYQYAESRALVKLVKDAAAAVAKDGEKVFSELNKKGSRWQKGEMYIFIIDTHGNTPVHPYLAQRNNLNLKDPRGRPFIKWFIYEVTRFQDKTEGWSHYLWKKPGVAYFSWKSVFIKLAVAPSGKKYIVGCGGHNLKMEKQFAMDTVDEAVALIEEKGKAAYQTLRNPISPFLYKDAYIFVVDQNGIGRVNPAFPKFEGKNMLDYCDPNGKYFIREMFDLLKTQDCGWVEYQCPKPGEKLPALKSTYVKKAKLGKGWVMVGSGVYLTPRKPIRTNDF